MAFTPCLIFLVLFFQPFNAEKKVFGYFSEWSIYDRAFSVEQIPAQELTHILYAFMLPNPSQADFDILSNNYPFPPLPYRPPPEVPEGTLVFHDEWAAHQNIPKLRTLKSQHPHLKVLISIGGWTLSWTLSKVFGDPTLRHTFFNSAVTFVTDNGFDGIDIDWEYPGVQGTGYNYVDSNDSANYQRALAELRAEMDWQSPNKHLELTAAMGCNPTVIEQYQGTDSSFDYILLMSYDFAGSWGPGGHLSGMYHNPAGNMNAEFNTHSAIQNTLDIGFPPEKICVGSPMYGRGWAKIVPDDPLLPIFGTSMNGPGISYSGTAGEPGLTSWRHLRPEIGVNGLQRFYDSTAQAVFVHNSVSGETWSYEDPQSVVIKAQFVVDNHLAGMLFWELSDDTRDGVENILTAAVAVLANSSQTQSDSSITSTQPDSSITSTQPDSSITSTSGPETQLTQLPSMTEDTDFSTSAPQVSSCSSFGCPCASTTDCFQPFVCADGICQSLVQGYTLMTFVLTALLAFALLIIVLQSTIILCCMRSSKYSKSIQVEDMIPLERFEPKTPPDVENPNPTGYSPMLVRINRNVRGQTATSTPPPSPRPSPKRLERPSPTFLAAFSNRFGTRSQSPSPSPSQSPRSTSASRPAHLTVPNEASTEIQIEIEEDN